ncbi:hypothetical protein [Thermoanaerobacterium sp. DL9XJH110]|uniref:hypothetical protein n=1 Tax=Thermoanaerobacterium sp. DL9XJH110 TaxID=3386643 RepID=UPI000EA8BDCC|nr:hypothetical protein DXT63_08605 [Thermoanaerobacteraceae bacterium SP2]
MKLKVKLEEVQKGDRINGKKVVEVVHRSYCKYVRLILEGGRDIIDGYYFPTPKYVDVER